MGEPQTYEEKKSCCKSSLSMEGSPAPDVYVDMDTVSIRRGWQSFMITNDSSDVVQCLLTSTEKLAQTSKEDDLIKSRSPSTRRDPVEDTVLILTTTSRSKTISNILPMVRTAPTSLPGMSSHQTAGQSILQKYPTTFSSPNGSGMTMAREENNLPACRAKGSLLSKISSRPYIWLFTLIRQLTLSLLPQMGVSFQGCRSTPLSQPLGCNLFLRHHFF